MFFLLSFFSPSSVSRFADQLVSHVHPSGHLTLCWFYLIFMNMFFIDKSFKWNVCGHPCASIFDEYLLSFDSFEFAIALAAGEEERERERAGVMSGPLWSQLSESNCWFRVTRLQPHLSDGDEWTVASGERERRNKKEEKERKKWKQDRCTLSFLSTYKFISNVSLSRCLDGWLSTLTGTSYWSWLGKMLFSLHCQGRREQVELKCKCTKERERGTRRWRWSIREGEEEEEAEHQQQVQWEKK